MILVISDDILLAKNLQEILSLNGVQQTVLKDDYLLHESDIENGIELIVYANSKDIYGDKFKWYLLANNLSHTPIIFLTWEKVESQNPFHKCIAIPFELEDFSDAISHFFTLN